MTEQEARAYTLNLFQEVKDSSLTPEEALERLYSKVMEG